ncbi:MAG: hypothetical protein QM767_15860 [Anaeromyxobacter sp.]
MTETAERFTRHEAIGVDVAAIERELAALWREAAHGTTAVMRACSWNLVVMTTPEQSARAKTLADVMVEIVPSRTLMINEQKTGDDLHAYVSANCRLLPGGGKMLCTEISPSKPRVRVLMHCRRSFVRCWCPTFRRPCCAREFLLNAR